MKKALGLLVLLVVALSQRSLGATSIYNYSNDWDGAGVQGFGGVWYTQWALWDCLIPANFTDMVWNSTDQCWMKADQPTHKVYVNPLNAEDNAIYADPNLKVVIGWQAPKKGTVNFLASGSNWYTQSIYQILDKNGTELASQTVASGSGGEVSASNISVATGDRVYFCYRPNSSYASSIFKHWPIKIEATFTPVNYRTSFVTVPFENYEGNFDWSILEGEGPVTLSKQGDVKFEGNYAMSWHFLRQTMQEPWTRGGRMFSASAMDWSAYSHVILKFKSNSPSAAGQSIFWDFYNGDSRVNGNSGCGAFTIPADTDWHTITLELADFPRNNVTNLEFYTSNDSFPVGTYDFYFDDIRLAIAVIPGDANNDARVDVSDLGILAANYGTTANAAWAMGDFNNDGKVDVSDLGILAANYGVAEGGMTLASAADFQADWAKAIDETVTKEEAMADTGSSICTGLGLPLMAGMVLAGMMLLGNAKFEE